ncbi:MAG: hypothetical protein AB8F78_00965 [Saprospiraceae bacterium]
MGIRFCFCLLVSLVCCISAEAQQYNTAAGLRIGGAGGVTAVQRIADHGSIEAFAVAGFNSGAFTITAIGRRHVPLITRQLNMFVGAGLHKGWGYEKDGKKGNPFGIDGQVGLEFNIKRATIAFDFVPQINLSGKVIPFALRNAVSFRYIIDQRKADLLVKLPWEDEAKQKDRLKKKRARQKAKKKNQKQRAKEGKSKWKMPWENDETFYEPNGNWDELASF